MIEGKFDKIMKLFEEDLIVTKISNQETAKYLFPELTYLTDREVLYYTTI